MAAMDNVEWVVEWEVVAPTVVVRVHSPIVLTWTTASTVCYLNLLSKLTTITTRFEQGSQRQYVKRRRYGG